MNTWHDASEQAEESARPSSWLARRPWRTLTERPDKPERSPSPTRPAATDPLRRWRLAVAAGLPLERPIDRAMTQVFQTSCALDALAMRAESDAQPPLERAELAAALRAAQGQLTDALQECDRLNTLLGHFRHLMSAAPSRPASCDLRDLVSLALYGARSLLPDTLTVANRLPALPPVLAERVELTQALIDALVQLGRVVPPTAMLTIDGVQAGDVVRVEIKAPEDCEIGRVGLALESAIDTVGRHRGTLEILSRRGALKLRLCLPAAA